MKKIIRPENYDQVLNEYQGGFAQIWLFNVSHKRLAIRLSRPNNSQVVYIVAISCEHITSPFSWSNARVSIVRDPNDNSLNQVTKIIDKDAGLELITSGGVGIALGDESDFDTSFENFLS